LPPFATKEIKCVSTRSVFESFSPVRTKRYNDGNVIASLTEHALLHAISKLRYEQFPSVTKFLSKF